MEKSNKFELKTAYIAFLIVCIFYYFISGIFDLEFENWERIICATTIASYFFSIAGAKKSIYLLTSKIIVSIKDSVRRYNEIKSKMIESPDEHKDSVLSIEDLELIIAEDKDVIEKCEKENLKNRRNIFLLNTLGYLVFFCILTFKYIYQFFEDSQDFYTLLAFVIILLTDAYEEYFMNKIGWLLNKNNENKE